MLKFLGGWYCGCSTVLGFMGYAYGCDAGRLLMLVLFWPVFIFQSMLELM